MVDIVKHITLKTIATEVVTAPMHDSIDADIISSAIEKNITIEDVANAPQAKNKTTLERDDESSNAFSFTDWLKNKNTIEKPIEIEPVIVAEIPDIIVVETPQQKVEKQQAEEILDKFIETQPRISKPKKEFYSPINMARQSVADNDELASETLATIYVAQGNFAKAIKVYDALMAKQPERKEYFELQIKKTREKNQAKNK